MSEQEIERKFLLSGFPAEELQQRLIQPAPAAVPPTLAALRLMHRKSLNRSTGRELQVVQLLLQ